MTNIQIDAEKLAEPSEISILKARITELEAENARLKPTLRAAITTINSLKP